MQASSHPREDKAKRVLDASLSAKWEHEGTTYRVRVPSGFEYRPGVGLRVGSLGLLDLLGPTYALESASAVHDYLYALRAQAQEDGEDLTGLAFDEVGHSGPCGISRAAADAAMMCDDADPRWVQLVAWAIVRSFGWAVW